MDIYKLGKVIDALKEYIDEKIADEISYHELIHHRDEGGIGVLNPDKVWEDVEQAIYEAAP